MFNTKYMTVFGLTLMALTVPSLTAKAGGCFSTTPEGKCVKWEQGKDIIWNYDAGPLKGPPEEASPTNPGSTGGASGCQLSKNLDVSNADGVALIERSFKRWTDIPTASLSVVKGTTLLNGEDVNFTNIEKVYAGSFVFPKAANSEVDASGCYDSDPNTPCLNPIIFDHSGLITDAINGQCAHCKILGFAAILPKTGSDPQGTILDPVLHSSQAVVSGACLEPRVVDPVCGDCCPKGITIDNIEGTMTHELGHYLGLDHTMVNKDIYLDCNDDTGCSPDLLEKIPTMIGFFVPNMDFKTLHQDDISTFTTLYPKVGNGTCAITGIAAQSGGTPQRGVEVVARNEAMDKQVYAVATIAGAFNKRNSQGVITASRTDTDGKNAVNCVNVAGNECGRFLIDGLVPGSYTISLHDFDAFPGDGSNIGFVLEPLTPPFAAQPFILPDGTQLDGYPEANSFNDKESALTGVVCTAGTTKDVGTVKGN